MSEELGECPNNTENIQEAMDREFDYEVFYAERVGP